MRIVLGWVLAALVSSPGLAYAQRLGAEADLVAAEPTFHSAPIAVAGNDRGYLVVFHRAAAVGWQLLAQRLDATASPVEGSLALIRTLGSPAGQVALVATPTNYGLLLLDDRTASFVVLDRNGNPSGEEVGLGAARRNIALTWDGTNFLAIVTNGSDEALGQRLDAIGQRVDATSRMLGTARSVALASSGDEYLLVRETATGLRAERLAADLTAIDATPFILRDQPIEQVAAGFDGSNYVVAWSEGDSMFEPRAARVSTEGEVLDVGGVRLAAAGPSLEISLAARPRHSLVAWATQPLTGLRQTRIAGLHSDGAPSSPVLVAEADIQVAGDERLRGVAVGGDTYASVVFAQRIEGLGHMRFRSRAVRDDGLGASCSGVEDCASGQCVRGVCCDSVCDGACNTCETGTCGMLGAETECRTATDACDVPEFCDGLVATCPAPITTTCETDAGAVGEADAASAVPPTSSGGCSVARRASSPAVVLLVVIACLWSWRVRAAGVSTRRRATRQ